MKLSGISFGGVSGGGTRIFSPHYKLSIYKDRKTKTHVTAVRERKHFSLLSLFMFISLPVDTFYFVLQFKGEQIATYVANNTSVVPKILSYKIPYWIFETFSYVLVFSFLLLIYLICFKGVKPWHGCEHKLIDAAEHNDIDNAKNHSRINDRCGGCYLFSIYTFFIIYWLTLYFFYSIELPVGALTCSFFFISLESRFFHKYNKVGIWFGRVLQKHITTSEPTDSQLNLGIKGMKELLEKEKQYEKENSGPVHFVKRPGESINGK